MKFTGFVSKSRKTKFINISYFFSASLITAIVSVIINPVIALNLTHYDYAVSGYYSSFLVLFQPLVGFLFGQYYSKNYFKANEIEREEMKSTLFTSSILIGFLEVILILFLFRIYHSKQNIEFPFYPYAVLSFASILFSNSFTFFLVDLKLKRNAKKFFRISISKVIVNTVLVLSLVVLLKCHVFGYMLSTFISTLVMAVVSFFQLSIKIKINRKILYDALKFCWPLVIGASLEYFFIGFDRSLLIDLGDTNNFALYNIAIAITSHLRIFKTTIAQTFQPDIFEAIANNNKTKLIRTIVGINIMNIIPIIIFVIFAPFVIMILTANRYTDAYVFARILALENITATLFFSTSTMVLGYGFTKELLIIKIVGSLLSIAIFKYLISEFGFMGAAWGQVLSFGSLFVFVMIFLIKKNYFQKA